MRCVKRWKLLILVGGISQLVLAITPCNARAAITPEEVRQSIQSGVKYIKSRQSDDGSWPDTSQPGGITALATLALIQAQVPLKDPSVAGGLEYLKRVRNEYTYTVALKIAVFAQADPVKYRDEIESGAKFLRESQLASGQWTYGPADPRRSMGLGDNSNTQFALLGLHEAATVGVQVPPFIWNKAARHWLTTQSKDGGWNYVGRPATGTGSMTAAGVSSLLICGHQVARTAEKGYVNGAAQGCGVQRTNPVLASGLKWLGTNFTAARNPRSNAWNYYWLYGAERVGMLSGLQYFGNHDWYREGAEYLINQQDGASIFNRGGSWANNLTDTCFAVLFLAKGRRPVLIQKLRRDNATDWNADPHDCANLVAFIGDDLGEPVSWQLVDVDAPLARWLEAPILYVTGHAFGRFTDVQERKIRDYVQGGGLLFVEACCSREAMREGFENMAKRLFREQPLVELDASHPVWTALHKLKPGAWPLYGLDVGCRTSVIFSPRDLSCLWEQADVPDLSEQALKLGANIAAYATGREPLRDKLSEIVLPAASKTATPARDLPGRGALQIAQLAHSADWRPDPGAMAALAGYLRKNANVEALSAPAFLRATDPALLDHPVAYMTGHFAFELTEAERAALATYLRRGGFLFAEACCGREAFASSFKTLVRQLFPNESFKLLDSDHPIIKGEPGFDLSTIKYRPAVLREHPKLTVPELFGVEVNGRLVIVFSPYGLGCGLEDHKCYNCRGVIPEDSKRLASNIVLHALSN